MLRPSDIALGRYLLVRGIVPRNAVEECLAELGRSDGSADLGILLANRQLINRADIQRLYTESRTALREQAQEDRQLPSPEQPTLVEPAPPPTTSQASKEMQIAWRRASLEDQMLAQLCLQRQLVDPTILTPLMQATGDATRSSSTQTLGQQLVRSRLLNPATYAALRNEIHSAIVSCPRCSFPLFSAPTASGHKAACPSCHSEVAIPPQQTSTNAPGSGSAGQQPGEAPPSSGSSRGLGSTSRVRRQIKGPPPCGETFGPYEIIRELGKGSTGTVYVGCDLRTNSEVAIKIFNDELSPRDQRRVALQQTLTKLRPLDHPNLLQVTDNGEREGRLYCVMPLVQGRSLNDLLRNDVDLEFGMEILEKVCRAVQHAHSAGLIHGDLKPQNIILTRDGEPRVADCGFSTALERRCDLSKPGVVIGTPYYMAPEAVQQPKDEQVETSDIFSIGVIMYELLTGRLPFVGRARAELRRRILQDDPEPPRRLRPSLTNEVEAVCLRCLDKAPEERYESASSLADDIKKLLEGKPVNLPMRNRVRMTLQRYRRRMGTRSAVLGAAGALTLMLLVSLAVLKQIQGHDQRESQRLTWDKTVSQLQSVIDKARASADVDPSDASVSDFNPRLRALNQALSKLASIEQKIARTNGPPTAAFDTDADATAAEGLWQTLKDDLENCRVLVQLSFAASSLENGDNLALQQGRGYLKAILERQPNHPVGHAIQTLYLATDFKHSQALDELSRAISNPRGDAGERLAWAKTAARLQDWEGVRDLLTPLIHEDDPTPGQLTSERRQALLLRAQAFHVRGEEPRRALEDVTAVLAARPADTEALLLRAILINHSGDEAAAERCLVAAEKAAPFKTDLIRAKIEMTNGWLEEAEAVADRALKQHPTNADALLTRATIRLARLNEPGMREDVDTLLATTPEHDRRRRALARALLSTIAWTNGDHARALDLATQANNEWPRVPEVLLLLGNLQLESYGNGSAPPDAAKTAFETLKKVHPTSGHADLGLGLSLLLNRDESPSRALTPIKRATHHLSFSARAWHEKAATLNRMNDPARKDEEQAAWQRASELLDDPRSPAGRLLLSGIAWQRQISALEQRLASIDQSEQLSPDGDSLDARVSAEKALNHALFHNPTNWLALVKTAELDSLSDQWSRALRQLDRIPDHYRKQLQVRLLHLQLLVESPDGNSELIENGLMILGAEVPGSPRLAAIKALKSTGNTDVWNSTPTNAASRSKFQQAIEDIDAALRASNQDPTGIPPYPSSISRKALIDQRSTLLLKLGKRAEARRVEEAEDIRARNAKRAFEAAHRSMQKLKDGQIDAAAEAAQRAIQINPENARGYAALCAALTPTRSQSEALQAGLKACLLDPKHQRELELLLLHANSAANPPSDSPSQAPPARRAPNSPLLSSYAALTSTIKVIRSSGVASSVTIERGISAANAALAKDRWFAPALAARAALLARAGKPEEAKRDARRVVLLTHESAPYTLLLLARLSLEERPGRPTSCIRWLRKAIDAGVPPNAVQQDSAFAPLRSDPRFQDLLSDQ